MAKWRFAAYMGGPFLWGLYWYVVLSSVMK